ncbi:MAG: tetratricopeptide repeat protein, partial [Chloroflexi bacterium]|nr:tetratricopeptide repeat protein [Chloroflexota bacterium]
MRRIHRGYLIAAVVLAVLAFVVSLWRFPEWGQSLRLIVSLAVAAVVGAFGFIAAVRQAVEKPDSESAITQTQKSGVQIGGSIVIGDVIGGDKFGGDKVAGDKIINILPPITPTSALHYLPPPPSDFTGREAELKDLREKMTPGGLTISGVHGLGGIGKTALALKLAAELAPRYPDAQFFVDLQGVSEKPLSPAEALSRIIHAYRPEARLPESAAELRGLYLSVLHGKKALVLMDNAKDAEQARPLIPPEGCLLLVTSRQRFTLPGLYSRNLDTMEPDEARDFLVKIAPRLANPPASRSTSGGTAPPSAQGAITVADEIAALCGYLPLALRAAGSLLVVTLDLSPEVYVTQLRDESKRLERIGTEGVEVSVEASLNLSYVRLSAETARAFQQLAVFPASFDAFAEEAVCEDAEHAHLSELVRRNLVRFSDESKRYSLHDLARLFAQKQLTASESYEAQKRHATHYKAVLGAANEIYKQGDDSLMRGLALFDLERQNIERGQMWAERFAEIDDVATAICSEYDVVGTSILGMRQIPQVRINWAQKALAAARRLNNQIAEGRHLSNLGDAYGIQSDLHQAINLYNQALEIARKSGDRLNEVNTLRNLGRIYRILGEQTRAIELNEQALDGAREINDRRNESMILNNLSAVYEGLGKFRRAIEYGEQALTIAREVGDRRGESNILNNLGNAYESLKDYRTALKFYEEASSVAHEIGDRLSEGNTLTNMGIIHYARGETHRAIDVYEKASHLFREIGDRSGVGDVVGNLGNVYLDLGETEKAIELFTQHLTISDEINYPIGKSNATGNLARAYNNLGQFEYAIEYFKKQLEMARAIKDPIGIGNAFNGLGESYVGLNEPRRALEFYEQALAIYREAGDRRGEGETLFNMTLVSSKFKLSKPNYQPTKCRSQATNASTTRSFPIMMAEARDTWRRS